MVPTRLIDEMSAYFHVGSTIWAVVACFKKSSISKALVMLAGWKGINELWLINKSPHVWRFKTINYPHSIASNNDSTRVELKLRGSFSWPKMSVSHWANYSMTLCFPYTSNRKAQYSAVNIRGSTYMNQLQFIINIAGETLLERANGGLVPHANLPDHRRIHSPRMLSSNGSRTPHQVMQLTKMHKSFNLYQPVRHVLETMSTRNTTNVGSGDMLKQDLDKIPKSFLPPVLGYHTSERRNASLCANSHWPDLSCGRWDLHTIDQFSI